MFNKQRGVSSKQLLVLRCWDRAPSLVHSVEWSFALEDWAHGAESYIQISGDSEDFASVHIVSFGVCRCDVAVHHWSQIGRACSIDVAELDADNLVLLATSGDGDILDRGIVWRNPFNPCLVRLLGSVSVAPHSFSFKISNALEVDDRLPFRAIIDTEADHSSTRSLGWC